MDGPKLIIEKLRFKKEWYNAGILRDKTMMEDKFIYIPNDNN